MIIPDWQMDEFIKIESPEGMVRGPASIDLTLGEHVRLPYEGAVHSIDDPLLFSTPRPLPYVLEPGEFALAYTSQVLTLSALCSGMVMARSTAGRCGIAVCTDAGYIDPGFSGQITLELRNNGPVPFELRPGDRLCQLVLLKLAEAPTRGYGETGRYQGQMGATEPR